ncbi:MAG: tetratricopeptide repeat protein [Cyanobacteria bacterium J06649_4]
MSPTLTLFAFSFWAWMIYDCSKHERDRTTWFLIIVLLNVLGSVIYFVVRWLPRSSPFVHRLVMRDKHQQSLQRAILDARNIGKAYQYVQLGHAYVQTGDRGHALAAYQQALAKDSDCIEALWGAALIELESMQLLRSRELLHRLMTLQPDYRFGEASLRYGRVLYSLNELDLALRHCEHHIQCWSHPEAYLLIAKVQKQKGKLSVARTTLETLITNVQASPNFYRRQNKHFLNEAQGLLASIDTSRSLVS